MAKITFKKGDYFSTPNGYGIALSSKQAIIITGKGGRTGYETLRGPIPEDATPHSLTGPISFEVQFALLTVGRAIA